MARSAKTIWRGPGTLKDTLAPLSALHEDPGNARAHGDRSVDAIAQSLARFGQLKPIIVDRAGRVVAGNGTLRAATKLGWTHLAATEFEGTADEADAFALVDNRTAELSQWNPEVLMKRIGGEVDDAQRLALGWNDAEYAALISAVAPSEASIRSAWSGMPEFHQDDTRAFQSVVVHLPTAADAKQLAELLGVTITDKTKTIWWPAQNTHVIETGSVYAAKSDTKGEAP